MPLDNSDFANDPQFQNFVEEQVQKQRYQNIVEKLTDKCWDLCVDKPTPRLEPKTENCLISCVERFMDSIHFVLNRFERANISNNKSSLNVGGLENLVE